MKNSLLASVSIAALFIVSEANAADLAVKGAGRWWFLLPVYSWTGCYVGAHAGWGRAAIIITRRRFSGGSGGGFSGDFGSRSI